MPDAGGRNAAIVGGMLVQPVVQNLKHMLSAWYRHSIKRLIVLLGCFLLVVTWLFVYYHINYDYERSVSEASKETMNLAKAFEEHVRRVIMEADTDLENLQQAYEEGGVLNPAFSVYWENMIKDSSRCQVAVINEQGVVIESYVKEALSHKVLPSREYYQWHQSTDNHGLHIGKTIRSLSSDQDVIPLTRRINKPDGSFGGMVYIALKTNYFLSFYQKIDLGPNQIISLNGRDGFNRTRRTNDDVGSGYDFRKGEVWRCLEAGQSSGSYMSAFFIDQVDRIASFRLMPDYPLVVLVGISTETALDSFEKRRKTYLIGASVITVCVVTLGALLLRWYDRKQAIGLEFSRLDRLNLVGEMAASIGHEVRNPLTTVKGYLQLLRRKEKFADYDVQITTMIDELERANSIITEFLSLAKNKSIQLNTGSINQVLDALSPLLQAEAYHFGQSLTMEKGDIPATMIDENEIRQLILNLVRNGFEAMLPGQGMTIRTFAKNHAVFLSVCDKGKGIPPHIMDKLGTPFITTKENGTGLGLAVCYRIAQRHHAQIDVKTSAEGTTFLIRFQAAGKAG